MLLLLLLKPCESPSANLGEATSEGLGFGRWYGIHFIGGERPHEEIPALPCHGHDLLESEYAEDKGGERQAEERQKNVLDASERYIYMYARPELGQEGKLWRLLAEANQWRPVVIVMARVAANLLRAVGHFKDAQTATPASHTSQPNSPERRGFLPPRPSRGQGPTPLRKLLFSASPSQTRPSRAPACCRGQPRRSRQHSSRQSRD